MTVLWATFPGFAIENVRVVVTIHLTVLAVTKRARVVIPQFHTITMVGRGIRPCPGEIMDPTRNPGLPRPGDR